MILCGQNCGEATRMIPRNALDAARNILRPLLGSAGCVVDATAGNGHDVIFICKNTLPSCRIWAFDIQAAAVDSCAALLERHGQLARVKLIQADHADLARYVREPVNAAIFNLGYLPGSDHGCTTSPASLEPAIESLTGLLAPGGLVAIVAYPGHEPGRREVEFLDGYLPLCRQTQFTITKTCFINQINKPAILYTIGNTGGK